MSQTAEFLCAVDGHFAQVGKPLRVRGRLRRETLLQRRLTAHASVLRRTGDNLSPQLINRLGELFPKSEHVYNLGMDQADDIEI